MNTMTMTSIQAGIADFLTTIPFVVKARTPTYRSAQHFVQEQYSTIHSANMSCDFPELLTVLNEHQTILAVAGIRTPEQPFYLEHYLDCSAEQALSEKFGHTVERDKIVEIGNLAGGKDKFATEFLMHRLWDHLVRSGYEYLILTGTRTLLRHLRTLPLHHLADADAGRVPNTKQWGNYYQQSPRVATGRLADYDFRYFQSRTGKSFHSQLLVSGA